MYTGWKDTMQKCYNWLEEMKKEDEKEKSGGNAST